jgi:hypothetical protein
MKVDFDKFKRSLPYASELYGIYQPLLGWRSRLRQNDISMEVYRVKERNLQQLVAEVRPIYELAKPKAQLYLASHIGGEHPFKVSAGEPIAPQAPSALNATNSIVARKVGELVEKAGADDDAWHKFTSAEALEEILAASKDEIQEEVLQAVRVRRSEAGDATMRSVNPDVDLIQEEVLQAVRVRRSEAGDATMRSVNPDVDLYPVLTSILRRESSVAGALRHLNERGSPAEIAAWLKPDNLMNEKRSFAFLANLTPQSDLEAATMSPIGLVHLYRQYFFEFDTFLGPPVQHLWLSPGGVVELVEVSTRRTLVERSTEQAFESIDKSEKSSMSQDELSDAVRSENASNTKLGVTLSSTGSYGVSAFVKGSTTVGSSFDADQSSKEAREQTHKSLRQQTDKLSSEIRKSFKSSFKTVTETTDTQSRRYVINNTTQELINYELRRKMRQVGVQVQDYGIQLCWQAYVDLPGDELGLAKLVHIAAPADLQGVKEPDAPVMPEREIRDKPFSRHHIHFGVPEHSPILAGFRALTEEYHLTPPKPGYIYSRTEVTLTAEGGYATLRAFPKDGGEAVHPGASDTTPKVDMIPTGDAANPLEPSVRSIVLGFQLDRPRRGDGHDYFWHVDVTVIWKPSQQLMHDVTANYNDAMAKFTVAQERAFREALYKSARDRVKLASNIEPRKFEELREEERIVVYRNLIRKLLEVAGITKDGITNEDPKVRHLFAELVQSMFDIDKMLYFVAPEWWKPSRRHAGQFILPLPKPGGIGRLKTGLDEFDRTSTSNWGGTGRQDDYYITEDSTRAPRQLTRMGAATRR